MHRRDFIVASAAAASLKVFSSAAVEADAVPDDTLRVLIRAADEAVPKLLSTQERRPDHPWVGGVAVEYGFHTVAAANGLVAALAAVACAPGSKYYRSKDLVEPIRLAIGAMKKGQHADGTVDYYATNFHSPPDLAFILESTCPACALLRANPEPELAALAEELKGFILPAAEALVTGGVHTPNHRWVVCAALAWVNHLYPNIRYIERIDQWLAEGIDIDPDGQYTERSTTVYSPIVNRALITVARLLGRPSLFGPVRKNLEMSLYYVHPDGEVVTEASRRQDKGTRATMSRYYYSYRSLALRDGDRRFAAMVRQIEREAAPRHPGELTVWLTEPDFSKPLPDEVKLPTDYEKVFSYSGLARIRRGKVSATILANSPTLFSLRKGSAALEAVRCASAFFGKGQVAGEALLVRDGRYVLKQELEGPYFQPLTKEQIEHGDHVRMTPNGTLSPDARALRKKSNVQRLESTLTITENQGKFALGFSLHGTDHVPIAVELGFRRGGTLEGVRDVPGVKEAYLLERGLGRYRLGEDVIEFGPGQAAHTYTQVRGALAKWDGLSVYLTGMTPFEFTLHVS